jgi:uncharacterized protein YdeI (YjbR/CyaY-like superfamily)
MAKVVPPAERPTPRFFKTPAEFRKWLASNHARSKELWVGFFKKASGKPSITYHEALDEALSVGWIDGVRKTLDVERYIQRFTPRRRGSYWSKVNIARARALEAAGRMTAPGLEAFRQRDEKLAEKHSFERESSEFDAGQRRTFEANKAAWEFFQSQPPGYRKLMAFFVLDAKKPETRERRLDLLIQASARGERLGPLRPTAKS